MQQRGWIFALESIADPGRWMKCRLDMRTKRLTDIIFCGRDSLGIEFGIE